MKVFFVIDTEGSFNYVSKIQCQACTTASNTCL